MGAVDNILKQPDECRSGGLPFLEVMNGQLVEELFAVTGQLDQYATPVIRGAKSTEKTSLDETVDQLDRAVVLELHPLRENSDGRFEVFGQASYGQQELMLLRFDAGFSGGGFAEPQEATDLEAKFGHRFEIRGFLVGRTRHK